MPESDPERFSARELTLSPEKVYFTGLPPGPARTERVSAGMPPTRPWKIPWSSGSADVVKVRSRGPPDAVWERLTAVTA